VAKKALPPSDDEPPKKKSRFKMIMILLSLLILLGGLAGGGYWWFFARPDAAGLPFFNSSGSSEDGGAGSEDGGMGNENGEAGEDGEGGEGGEDGETDSDEEVQLDDDGNPIILSLDESIKKAKKDAKGSKGKAKKTLKPVSLPPLTVNLADPPGNRSLRLGLDVEITHLDAIASLKINKARILDGLILLIASRNVRDLITPEGKVLLKNEIAAKLNQIIGAPQIARIYFTEFMIQ